MEKAQKNSRYRELVNLITNFSDLPVESTDEVFSKLMRKGHEIIGSDYASVYILENSIGRFLDADGYDINILNNLEIKSEYIIKPLEITKVNKIFDMTFSKIPEKDSELFLKGIHQVKETLICPLVVENTHIGAICFDISVENNKTFSADDIEIAKVIKEIADNFLTIKNSQNNLNKINTELQNSIERNKNSSFRFMKLVDALSKLSEMIKMNDDEIFPFLLRESLQIIGCDYGSAVLAANEYWEYIDTIGHDLDKLKKLAIKKEFTVQFADKVIILNEPVKSLESYFPSELHKNFNDALKPIKSSIVCPLIINGEQIGGLMFDLSINNPRNFDDMDVKLASVFKEIAETFIKVKYYTNELDKTKIMLEEYNLNLEEKVKERTIKIEEAQLQRKNETELKINAQLKQRLIAEELKDSLKQMTSSLLITDVYNSILDRLYKIIPYNSAQAFSKKGLSYESVVTKGSSFNNSKIEIDEINNQNHICFNLCSDKNNCRYFSPDNMGLFISDNTENKYFCLPITIQNKIIGLIRLICDKDLNLSEIDASYLTAFMELAALASENALLFEEKNNQAILDGLTSLYNRRHFYDLASKELYRTQRYGGELSVIMLDIDHFKNFNDSYGHLVGDEVLVFLSKLLKYVLRDTDIICRYGGEEFLILLTETSMEDASNIAERLRHKVADSKIFTGAGELSITISLGVTFFKEDFTKLEDLLAAADEALYKAKNTGRNKVVCDF